MHQRRCCAVEDIGDARTVCDQLGVPHYVINYERSFGRDVVDYFVREYSLGRTPNPCVICNRRVKFRELWELAQKRGLKKIATGHYARRLKRRIRLGRNGFWRGWFIKKAKDKEKDQSYFLSCLPQEVIAGCEFPLGNITKKQVKEKARQISTSSNSIPNLSLILQTLPITSLFFLFLPSSIARGITKCTPFTSQPCFFNKKAAMLESTPPDMATKIFLLAIILFCFLITQEFLFLFILFLWPFFVFSGLIN